MDRMEKNVTKRNIKENNGMQRSRKGREIINARKCMGGNSRVLREEV